MLFSDLNGVDDKMKDLSFFSLLMIFRKIFELNEVKLVSVKEKNNRKTLLSKKIGGLQLSWHFPPFFLKLSVLNPLSASVALI